MKKWKKLLVLFLALMVCAMLSAVTVADSGEDDTAAEVWTEEVSPTVGNAVEDIIPIAEEPAEPESVDENIPETENSAEEAGTIGLDAGEAEKSDDNAEQGAEAPDGAAVPPSTDENQEIETAPEEMVSEETEEEISAESGDVNPIMEEHPTSESSGEIEEIADDESSDEPLEIEVEEGVFHIYPAGSQLKYGVYDTDFPEADSFEMTESGKSLNAGNTVHFKVKISDIDGISRAYIRFGNSYSNYYNGSQVDLKLNGATGFYEGNYTFTDNDTPGEYYAVYLYAEDAHGFTTYYSNNAKRVMQRLLPGFVYLTGETGGETQADLPENFVFVQDEQTLTPGNTLDVSFTAEKGLKYASVYLYVSGTNGFSIDSNAFTYDETTGAVTGKFSLTAEHINGKYKLSSLSFYGYDEDYNSTSKSWNLYDLDYSFTLTGAAEKGSVTITDIRCEESGKTLKDGDTVHISFVVNTEETVNSARVSLSLFQAWDSSWGTGVSHSAGSKSVIAKLNATSGRYEAEYTFSADNVYGVYKVGSVSVSVGNSSVSKDTDIMILFAENSSDSIARLQKAKDLNWTDDGHARFTMPDNHCGKAKVYFYKEDGTYINGISYTSLTSDTSWTKKTGSEYFLRVDDDLASGNYYFTVTVLGDGDQYYDSETAVSGLLRYERPSAQLGSVAGLEWETYGDGSTKRAKFTAPADRSFIYGFDYEWYFSETKTGKPVRCAYSGTTRINDAGYGYVSLSDNLLQRFGSGYYYYKVRLLSNDLFKCRHGEWSELSPAYHVVDGAEAIVTQLDDVETSGQTPAKIREQVHQIPTEELRQAMLADKYGTVSDKLRELEAATGSQTVVVSKNVPELATGVSTLGAGLNDVIKEGKVTLVIDKPQYDDVLPAMYDNALSVRFSMNLQNVANTGSLKVPVLIDLPIPEKINPSFLVLLHYHAAGGTPVVLNPYVYEAGGKWYAQFVLTGFSDFILTEENPNYDPNAKFVPNTYLLLTKGDSTPVSLYEDSESVLGVAWRVTDVNGKPFKKEADAVISVNNGTVTALKVGTAYVAADITMEGDEGIAEIKTARCRIDVISDNNKQPIAEAVTQVTLANSNAAVELFSTDYTTVTLLPERNELLKNSILDEEDVHLPADNGAAIQSAKFTGTGAELFRAVVTDDMSIAIVPEYSTLELALKQASKVMKSYTFGIELTMSDGSVYTAKDKLGNNAVLKITVKQTQPALKAASLKFNRALPNDYQSFVFSPFTVAALEPDKDSAAKAKKTAVPDWMILSADGIRLSDKAPSKASGSLYLLATLDGWAVKKPVKVNYSVTAVYPTVSFSPKSVSLKAGTADSVDLTASLKPVDFADQDRFPISVKITEGEKTWKNGTVLQVNTELQTVDPKSAVYRVNVNANGYTDGKAHTYDVKLGIAGKTFSFTVKTTVGDASLSVKSSGTIEALAKSGGITLLPSFKNYHGGSGEKYSVAIRMIPSGSKEETDVPIVQYDADNNKNIQTDDNAKFLVEYNSGTILISQIDDLPTATYNAYISATLADGSKTNTVKAKMNVKWSSPSKVKLPVVSLKLAKGSIDPIRSNTEADFFIKVGTQYYVPDQLDYEIIKTVANKGTILNPAKEPFAVSTATCEVKKIQYPCVSIAMREGASLEANAVYSIRVSTKSITGADTYTPAVKIPVKMGSVKMMKVENVSLLYKDKYSNAEFTLTPTDSAVSSVSKVQLDPASASLFEIHEVGNGTWAIGYKGNKVPAALKSGTSKAVKLSVWFEGNNTAKANVTVSFKVTVL